MNNIFYKYESYRIVGICMEVHNYLGPGFLEVVYKDALSYEFAQAGIPFEREKKFDVHYKDTILQHSFFSDFVVYNTIILEVKGKSAIGNDDIAQALNYIKVSDRQLAIIVNFGEAKLNYRRLVF